MLGGIGGSSTAKPKSAQADEEMPTAKPKKRGGEKAKASPKAKKVSHARKVSLGRLVGVWLMLTKSSSMPITSLDPETPLSSLGSMS